MNLPPSPRPLPLRGGEGARRAGEGAVHGPDACAKAKGGFHEPGGRARLPSSPNSYPLEIRARRSLAPPFMVPMRYLNKISRAAFNNAFISSSLPMVMRRKSFVSG